MNKVRYIDILCRIFNRKFQQVKQLCHSELPGFKEFIPETKKKRSTHELGMSCLKWYVEFYWKCCCFIVKPVHEDACKWKNFNLSHLFEYQGVTTTRPTCTDTEVVQVSYTAGTYSSFCSINRLQFFLLSLNGMLYLSIAGYSPPLQKKKCSTHSIQVPSRCMVIVNLLDSF